MLNFQAPDTNPDIEKTYDVVIGGGGITGLTTALLLQIAIYRNEHGKLLAIDPVCPHAGCLVSWNNTERTWDCSCHGGRYAPDGTLLTEPAQKGLQQLEWSNE